MTSNVSSLEAGNRGRWSVIEVKIVRGYFRKSYLILICTPHTLHNFLRLRLRDSPLLSHNLRKHRVHLSCHVRSITTHVEIGFLEEQLIDFFGVLLESVLDVDFLGAFAREGGDEGEFVAEGFFVGLFKVSLEGFGKRNRRGGIRTIHSSE
jgi:hypothetical protein